MHIDICVSVCVRLQLQNHEITQKFIIYNSSFSSSTSNSSSSMVVVLGAAEL
jgi:hypothetical protein